MNDLTTLPGTWAFAWAALSDGVAERTAPCRTGALATVGNGGEARMVVLRAADPVSATVEVHSDTAAAKVAQLTANPRATLLFWMPETQVQLRLRADFHILTGDAVDDRWRKIPNGPRQAYGGMPPPGETLADPTEHDTTPQRARFAVLIGTVEQLETLHLGDVHRRAVFTRADGFKGAWIAP